MQHALMLRLLFFTAVRVSELCGIEVSDVDLENCKVFVNQGKGLERPLRPVRQVASPRHLVPTLPPIPPTASCSRPVAAAGSQPGGCSRWSSCTPGEAGVNATPHTFRHQAITWLTKNSGPGGRRAPASSRGTPGGRPWRYTSTSPWTGSLPTSTRPAMKEAGL